MRRWICGRGDRQTSGDRSGVSEAQAIKKADG